MTATIPGKSWRSGTATIPLQTWFNCKRDFIHGKFASIAQTARAHSLNVYTVQNRAKRERWSVLRQQHFDRLNASLLAPEPAPEPPQTPVQPQTPASAGNPEVERINRQLDRLNDLLDTETDAKALDKLSATWMRLHERRRILLRITLPGSDRPTRRGNRPQAGLRPIEATEA